MGGRQNREQPTRCEIDVLKYEERVNCQVSCRHIDVPPPPTFWQSVRMGSFLRGPLVWCLPHVLIHEHHPDYLWNYRSQGSVRTCAIQYGGHRPQVLISTGNVATPRCVVCCGMHTRFLRLSTKKEYEMSLLFYIDYMIYWYKIISF